MMCKKFSWTPTQYYEQDYATINLMLEFMRIEQEEERLKSKRSEQKTSIK